LTQSYQKWVIIITLMLLVAASRFTRLDEMAMNPDEVWSAWQTLGTPAQILQWTPYDWPPLYYLTLGAWRGLTGPFPTTLRVLSALVFMIGAAISYRFMRRLRGESAGILAMLAYAALGYGILLSIEVRGYALLLALMPLSLWLTIRYYERPHWKRAVPLALALNVMFYTSLTSVGAIVILGLYALVVYRRAIWRGWLPGLLTALLALPEILTKWGTVTTRVKATATLTPLPFFQALADLFARYAGYPVIIWALLFVAASAAIVYQRGFRYPHVRAFAIWVIVIPVILYLLNPILGFFSARYAWWVMLGIALWTGWGLSHLPRIGTISAALLLAGLAFYPLPMTGEYNIWGTRSPLAANFEWLRGHLQGGDMILADSANECGSQEEWDYFLRAYFPNGLQFIERPESYRRVWHIYFDGRQNSATQQALDTAHVPGIFVGPAACVFRLYEGPPNVNGIAFENGMRFHGADVMENQLPRFGPFVRHEGEIVRLRLWWSAERQIDRDYSVGIYLLREGSGPILTQTDSAPQVVYPQDAPHATSQWQPNGFYIEERELTLPYPLRDDHYEINLAVYYWEDQRRIPAPGVNSDTLLPLIPLKIKAY
jgi:hypothetical protein